MAKMNKKVKTLIAAIIVVVLLGAALAAVLLLQGSESGGDTSSDTSSVESDTSITLVEQKQEDVKNIHVENQKGSYDVALVGDEQWEIAQLKGFEQNANTYSAVTNAAAEISASKILLETQENLKEYGLEQPKAVVTITYKDGTTFQMNLGDDSPEGGVYMTVAGKDPVYIYSGDASYFAFTPYDYLDTTIVEAIDTTTSDSSGSTSSGSTEELIVDRFEIQRPDLDKPIVLVKNEEDAEESNSVTYSTYQMTSPVKIMAADEKLGTNITGFFGLSASSVEVLKPTAAQKKERGFSNPTAIIKVNYDSKSYVLRIGNAITCEETDDPKNLESGHTHSIVGYNVMLDGKNLIYNVSPSSLPWLELEANDITSPFVVLPNILDVKRVTIAFDGKTYVFDVSNEKDEDDVSVVTAKYNGKTLTEDYFKSYYQLLLSLTQSGINTKSVSGSPILTLQYEYTDSARKTDKLEFFDNGEGAVIIRHNGEANFLTKYSLISRIKQNTALIIQNKEIDAN